VTFLISVKLFVIILLKTKKNEKYKKSCSFNRNSGVSDVRVDSFVRLPSFNEEAMKAAVYRSGPIAVSIYASSKAFQMYAGGVFSTWNGETPNHAVTIVGYGTEIEPNGPKDYWLIRNSWGTDLGLAGYWKIARGVNMLGVSQDNDLVYPLVSSKSTPPPVVNNQAAECSSGLPDGDYIYPNTNCTRYIVFIYLSIYIYLFFCCF